MKFCKFHYASVLVLNAAETNKFAANSMQINFIHNLNNKTRIIFSVPFEKRYLNPTSGWVMCEYNVIVPVKKGTYFQIRLH